MGAGLAKSLLALCLAQGASAEDGAGAEIPGQVVDMVVATVDERIITLSELIAETGIVLLETRGPEIALDAGIPRSLLRSVLESMVNLELMRAEVRRLQLRPPERDAAERASRNLLERFEDEADRQRFLQTYGFDPQSLELLQERVRLRLEVDRFIDLRIRLTVEVTPEWVRRCYERNAVHFGSATLDDVRELITVRLRQQLERRSLEELLDRLRGEAEIRYTSGYEPLPASTSPEPWSCPLP